MTALFIMILPEKEMGLRKLVKHQCGYETRYRCKVFFYKNYQLNICRSMLICWQIDGYWWTDIFMSKIIERSVDLCDRRRTDRGAGPL